MRIATVTCHDVYNHGASLQAFALQKYCESLGHDYIILDYKPDYLSGHYKLLNIANPKFDRPVIKQLYRLAKLPGRLLSLRRKKKFDNFRKEFLNVTKRRFPDGLSLKKAYLDYDVYMAGSDQIWNPLLKNGHDPTFYLDFVGSKGKKISYAASFATESLLNGTAEFVKNMLQNFDSISVREKSGLKILKQLGFTGKFVLDPVFLLDKSFWETIQTDKKLRKKEYILLYDFDKGETIKQVTHYLKTLTGLPIFSVSPGKISYADRNFMTAGPLEFLGLIKGARYVVSNSFHATAFAIIFHKDFYVVNRTESINCRMRDLLESIGLQDRLVNNKSNIPNVSIDYSFVEPYLNPMIEKSKNYLEKEI